MRKFSYIQLIFFICFQLFLLHVFFIRVAHEIYPQKNGTVLKIYLPDDEPSYDPDIIKFSGPDILSEWRRTKKKFIQIDFTGETKEDKKRFEFIRMEARRLKYTYDTVHILKIHFTEENTYGQFVQLVSIMQEDHHKRYVLYKDDFYILGESPPEQ
jgi:hypothetical protein